MLQRLQWAIIGENPRWADWLRMFEKWDCHTLHGLHGSLRLPTTQPLSDWTNIYGPCTIHIFQRQTGKSIRHAMLPADPLPPLLVFASFTASPRKDRRQRSDEILTRLTLGWNANEMLLNDIQKAFIPVLLNYILCQWNALYPTKWLYIYNIYINGFKRISWLFYPTLVPLLHPVLHFGYALVEALPGQRIEAHSQACYGWFWRKSQHLEHLLRKASDHFKREEKQTRSNKIKQD